MQRWVRQVRGEWGKLTGGPVSLLLWLVGAAYRTVFAVVIFGIMGLLVQAPEGLEALVDGQFVLALGILVSHPEVLAVLALVGVVAFVLPFLPRKEPWEQ